VKRIVVLAGMLGVGSAGLSASKVVWPELPRTGFIKERPATEEDIRRGNAVFSQAGTDEGALKLEIPQYVLWKDEDGRKHPMILVQAERSANGTDVVGLRDFAGSETVATLPEVTLLGTKKPN
jgi:translation elongation factor EF-Tu-like GTPase